MLPIHPASGQTPTRPILRGRSLVPAIILAAACLGTPAVAEESPVEGSSAGNLRWEADYAEATQQAKRAHAMLLIYFEDASEDRCRRFAEETLSRPEVRRRMRPFTLLRVPVDATIRSSGKEIPLLKHSAFAEMLGQPGIAIVDHRDPESPYYGAVVSTFPLPTGGYYDAAKMNVILDLPPGSLTQRTLVYAVRTHPDHPAGSDGELDPMLASEAMRHSEHQARIRRQGHHQWESRFHRITGRLPAGLVATEVCAESWPGEGLLEAAIDCVACWRYSSGHWRSVSAAHPRYAFDMRRGLNGIWYATGIFGKRR